MKTRKLSVKNDIITIYESEGSGQVALIVAGNSSPGVTFQQQLIGIPGKRFRLIAIDLPGHSQAPPAADPREMYCMSGYVALLGQIIEQLDLENWILIGHSLGGHIALEACTELQGVKGCMIFGTPPLANPPQIEEAFLPIPELGFMFKNLLTKEESELWASSMVTDPDVCKVVAEQLFATDPKTREYLGESVTKLEFKNEVEIVRHMNIPLAILQGKMERLINLDYIRSLQTPTLWRGKVQLIDNAGHFPQMENADQFNEFLIDFIESVED